MSRRPFLAAALVAAATVAGATPTEFHWARAVVPSGDELRLEMAVAPEDRARGYMERAHVADDEGMLFIFDRVDHHGIWMRNCLVALDIVWLDADLRVVEIAPRLPPCPPYEDDPEALECPVRQPLRAARYVLEVAAGRAAELGLAPGASIVVLSDPELP